MLLKQLKNIKQMLIACIFLLLVSIFLNPLLPYGFYNLLRISVFGIFVFIYFNQIKIKKFNLLNILIVILFNPFFPIHLEKEIWLAIDFLVILYCYHLFKLYNKEFQRLKILGKNIIETETVLEILNDWCSNCSGIMKTPSKEILKITELVKKQDDKYDVGEGPKLIISKEIENIYICSHTWTEPAENNDISIPQDCFISWGRDIDESLTLQDLYEACEGNLYFAIDFIFGDRSFNIDMDAFNKYILPQLLAALRVDIFANKNEKSEQKQKVK